jgi:hypothetical protein
MSASPNQVVSESGEHLTRRWGTIQLRGSYLNDRGQIAGDAILNNGDTRAHLLTACDEDDPCGCRCDLADASATTADGAPPSNAARTAERGERHLTNLRELRRFGRRYLPGSGRTPSVALPLI